MIEHDLTPEHERVASEASERIRAVIAGRVASLAVPPPEGAFEDEEVS